MPPRPAMSLRLPSLSANKLLPFAFWLFLFSLPLGTRKLLWRFTAGFDEYEAVFLYASDIFLAAFLVLFCFSRGFGGLRPKIGGNFLAASLCFLVLFSAFSVLSADYSLLALTAAIRLFLAVAASGLACQLICTNHGFAAVMVMLLGLGILAGGFYFLGRIFTKNMKLYKHMTRAERQRERRRFGRTGRGTVIGFVLLFALLSLVN